MASSHQLQLIKNFLVERKILIVDPSTSSRIAVQKILVDLGVRMSNVVAAPSYHIAIQEIEAHKPSFVVSDFHLEQSFGLDLFGVLKSKIPSDPAHIFILVTSDSNETSIAEAAEEDVDAYILKPFTSQKLERYFIETILSKLTPDEYKKTIQSGKTYLLNKKFDEALREFSIAKAFSDKPCLAHYYTGQCRLGKKEIDRAIEEFNDGLRYNPIHYKCLVGLFDGLIAKRDNLKAYEVVHQITSVFPVSPQRLGTVLRLAVETENYEDIDRYYKLFTTLEHRPDPLIKAVSAALTVSGVYLLQRTRIRDAVDMFNKASISSARNPKILKEIIHHLVRYQWHQEAEEFMKHFSSEARDTIDYRILDCLLADGLLSASHAIAKGRKIMSENTHDPSVYRVLVKRYLEQGWDESAESLCDEALKRWPHLRSEFNFSRLKTQKTDPA